MRTKPTTAKQKTPVPEEVKSLERYELEKQKKLLIILLKSGRSRVCVSSRSGERIDGEAGEVSSKKLSLIRLLSLQLVKLPEAKQFLIKLPEARQLVTNRPKKARLVRDKAVESPVWAEKPVEAKKGPRGRRRWWNVRGERICWRSAGGLLEVCRRSAERCRRMW